jgi:glutamate---cysteine ligase / carboxylate-amine ligase
MTLHLWQGYGIELEYMIVDRQTLAVRPISDALLQAVGGVMGDIEREAAGWSNELVMHVIEFKTNGPAPELAPLPAMFNEQVRVANLALEMHDAMLLPTGMHPYFNPMLETKIWPHEYNVVYNTYNRIFDCRGHGWSNLQSTHLNLPFADDAEFARLHAAVRCILPLIPGLAAASPVADGVMQKALDYRLVQYAANSARIPSATGDIIPEPIYTRDEYYDGILRKIWADTAPFDPDGNLEGEYANARGAIARFDRMAIEIRLIDIQECPQADIAICAAIVSALKALAEGRWIPVDELKQAPVKPMASLLREAMVTAEHTVINDAGYLRTFGVAAPATIGELWDHLIAETLEDKRWLNALKVIRGKGTLATRIKAALGESPNRQRMDAVYQTLARCLATGEMFDPAK